MSVGGQGQVVGAYRLVREIGSGGMGTVWLAEHTLLGRRAAVKLLHSEYSHHPMIAARFFNEAKAASAIHDPGIVQIFEFGTYDDDRVYIVMEMLEGEPLDRRLARCGALGLQEALVIVRQVATSLSVAHARGVVHRDLKPENIFLMRDPEVPGGERAKILDFGIAKLFEDKGAYKTNTSSLLGTPTYMSPEQCRGAAELDQRSDIYSLGCVLFALLTGHPPFRGIGAGDIIVQHVTVPAPLASSRTRGVPPTVDRLIARCLEKEPHDRFASAAELASAISRALGQTPMIPAVTLAAYMAPSGGAVTTLSASSISLHHTPPRRTSSLRVIFAIGAAVAIAGAIAIAVLGSKPEPSVANRAVVPDAPVPAPAVVMPDVVTPDAAPLDNQAETTRRIAAAAANVAAWTSAHAGAACPTMAELGGEATDGWGHALVVTCSDQPPDQILGIVSTGEDGTARTADDIASWSLAEVAKGLRGDRWRAKPVVRPKAKSSDKPSRSSVSGDLDGDGIPDTR